MNPKTTIGLVVALAIAVAGVWWAQSSASKDKGKEERPGPKLLLDPPLGELVGFEVKSGSEPAIVFEMQDDKWRMTAPVDWPAEHFSVNSDATRINNLKYVKTYSEDEADRPTVEMTSLADPLKIVKLTDAEGKSCVVKIGARQKLSEKTYVQREGHETIYLVDADLNKEMRKALSDYRGKRVAEFKQNDAVRIEVSGEHHYTLVKSDGKWTVDSPVKGRADRLKVSDLLRSLSGLSVEAFVDDAPKSLRPYGLEKPRLKVAVTTETKTPKPPPPPPASAPAEPEYEVETRAVRLAFGPKAGDEVFAKIDEESSPTVFKVSEDVVDRVAPTLNDLRDKKITAVVSNRVQQISVSCGDESVELVKSGRDWEIASDTDAGPATPAEFAAVDDLLKAIRDLKAIGFETTELPTHGLDHPRASVKLAVEGQLKAESLTVGGLTPSKTGAYVRNDREGFIAVVGAASAEALIVKPMSFLSRDLLKFSRSWASKLDIVGQDGHRELMRDRGAWRFTLPIRGKAETGAVNDILKDLSSLRGRRVVGLAADAAEFGLDDPAVRITVTVESPPKPRKEPATQPTSRPTTQPASQPATGPADEVDEAPEPPVLHTVLVGRRGGKTYAMLEGGMTICEVDAKVLENLDAELFDTRVATLKPSEAVRLAFSGAVEFAFEKPGNDWVLSGEPSFQADATKITNTLNALFELRAKRYVLYSGANPAEFGLDRPAVTVEVETDSGELATLLISAQGPEEGGRYAAVSASPSRVFVIAAEDVEKFTKQVNDFQKGS